MLESLNALFASNGFIPHGHCYLWKPGLVGLHIASDTSIGLAYFAISVTLALLVRKTQLPFHWMFLAFGLFIAACGLTHFMEVWTLWHPVYWLSGEIKLITAAASVTTAVLLPPLVPQVVGLVETAKLAEDRRLQLETANQELEGLYQRVKELDQLKTQFFANVSHELRTPLTLVLGLTERLVTGELNIQQQQDLTKVDSNARTLLKYVNELLDISKLEAGKMSPHYTAVDLVHLVRLIAAYFDTVAQERQISFSVTAPQSLLTEVDPEKIERVLLNLLSNAFKFVPTGGYVRCEVLDSGDHAIITVQDNGPGIPLQLRQVIFERFQQGDRSSEQQGGTGLGLAIVKDFVELHYGVLSVEDAPEGGALFRVELPVAAPPGAAVEFAAVELNQTTEAIARQTLAALRTSSVVTAPVTSAEGREPADPQPSSRPLVLVVEDNPDMSQFIAETLSADYNIAKARDGQEGLEQAIALHPDLILTDMMMPRMSGEQLVRAVRSKPELDIIPIVLLTAKTDRETQIDLLREGAQDYLMKPFAVEELRARVENLITIKQIREVLQQELTVRSQDVASLTHKVSLRRQELREALAALQAAHSELELRVEQRTLELSQANIDLQAEIAERQRIEAVLRISQESIQNLYEIVADQQLSFTEKIELLLVLGCQRFQLDIGILAQVSDDAYRLAEVKFMPSLMGAPMAIARGNILAFSSMYGREALQAGEPFSIEHAGASAEWRDHPCYLTTKLEAFIATPIFVTDKIYGTLSFSSPTPRRVTFTPEDKKFLQLMAQWIGGEIARQQTEQQLRQSEASLTEAQRIAHVGSWDFDVATQQISWSEELFRIFGLDPTQPAPTPEQYRQRIHPDDRPLWQAAVERAYAEAVPYELDLRIIQPSGAIRHIGTRGESVWGDEGKVTRMFGTVIDISDRKQAELEICTLNAELEQRVMQRTAELEAANQLKDELLIREQEARAEAEAVNRMKDEFLATLSHELRTPLNSILGWAQLLRTRKFDEATTRQALETIERNARSQAQLVSDILDVSRIIRGKMNLNIRSVELVSLIRTALDSVRPAADAKSIQIQFSSDSELDSIPADPERLQQVIWNLLSNAIKFTPQGGRVDVQLSIEGSEEGSDRQISPASVQIQVSDTGEGISPQFLPYVFDRFRQADSSIDRPHGGLGLGLSIVRHLVELHGGTVQAESQGEEQGATFTVKLPLQKDVPSETRNQDGSTGHEESELNGRRNSDPDLSSFVPHPSLLCNLRVLVVDDEADTRDLLTMLLEQCGAEVRAIASASSAIEILTNESLEQLPDILISDIGMPEQDGYGLIRQVRAIAAVRQFKLPAVALTAYARVEDRIKLLQAGFQMHIPKPVDAAELVTAVANLAGRIDLDKG